jgi:hypothetical protein
LRERRSGTQHPVTGTPLVPLQQFQEVGMLLAADVGLVMVANDDDIFRWCRRLPVVTARIAAKEWV